MTIDDKTITLDRCHVDRCQVCGKSFEQIELVYYVPLDNNLICRECADNLETGVEPRIHFDTMSLWE